MKPHIFASLFCTYMYKYKCKTEIISMHIAVNVYVRNYHKIRTLASAKKKCSTFLHPKIGIFLMFFYDFYAKF